MGVWKRMSSSAMDGARRSSHPANLLFGLVVAGSPAYAQAAAPGSPVATTSSDPRTLDVDGVQPIPPGYRLETRPRTGLVAAGALGFGAGWLSAMTVAGGSCGASHRKGDGSAGTDPCVPLFFPVVGPFVFMGVTESLDPGWAAFLGVNGAVQIAGAAAMVIGLLVPEKRLVRNDAPAPRASFAPVVGSEMLGFSLAGSF